MLDKPPSRAGPPPAWRDVWMTRSPHSFDRQAAAADARTPFAGPRANQMRDPSMRAGGLEGRAPLRLIIAAFDLPKLAWPGERYSIAWSDRWTGVPNAELFGLQGACSGGPIPTLAGAPRASIPAAARNGKLQDSRARAAPVGWGSRASCIRYDQVDARGNARRLLSDRLGGSASSFPGPGAIPFDTCSRPGRSCSCLPGPARNASERHRSGHASDGFAPR